MKDLLNQFHDFAVNHTFTGKYSGSDEKSHRFTTQTGDFDVLIPKNKYTDKGASLIAIGDVVQVVAKGNDKFDVFVLDADEVSKWIADGKPKEQPIP